MSSERPRKDCVPIMDLLFVLYLKRWARRKLKEQDPAAPGTCPLRHIAGGTALNFILEELDEQKKS